MAFTASVIDLFRPFARIFALSRRVQQCQREATAGSGLMVTKSRQTMDIEGQCERLRDVRHYSCFA